MTEIGPVTVWLKQLRAGDREAVQKLWEGYFPRLVGLARKRLQGIRRPAADEEDIALSAFASFCRGAEEGRFARLSDRDDLWQLLVLIAARKAANLMKYDARKKRGGNKARRALTLAGDDAPGDGPAFLQLISRDPDPALAAEVAERYRALLQRLGSAELRTVAVMKMEGYTNAEIAAKLGRSEGTVERKLQLIRRLWSEESER